ncbi:MAG TPA: DinB family protein [Pirellulaceae bacterium]|nr:DinB family protein [Pirellulaceae bacterium]
MSTLQHAITNWQFNRPRTLGLLEKIEQQPDPQKVLSWRPGPGRAHLAWQFMHIGITEELFATERLVPGTQPAFADLVPRFRGGSTPDDNIPPASLIRQILTDSREHLLATISRFSDGDLGSTFQIAKDRQLSLSDVLHILAWHEPHHQGQAHITFNLYKSMKPA